MRAEKHVTTDKCRKINKPTDQKRGKTNKPTDQKHGKTNKLAAGKLTANG